LTLPEAGFLIVPAPAGGVPWVVSASSKGNPMKPLSRAMLFLLTVTAALAFSLAPGNAAETTPQAPAGIGACVCPCMVDGAAGCAGSDLQAFRPYFLGTLPFSPIADYNCDGLIGLQDLNILRIYLFGPQPPPAPC